MHKSKRIFITGANGFIGSNLIDRILQTTNWTICGMDLHDDRLQRFMGNPSLSIHRCDISKNHDLIESEIAKSDVVIPLAAVANPMFYITHPLETFNIVFEENLFLAKTCHKFNVQLIFPSTSESYGMGSGTEFQESSTHSVFGPVSKERWIYGSSKHLLERVIWAMGHSGLNFTIFRPFNWFGPNLDDINNGEKGGSRVVTLFLGQILRGETINLVNGGHQTRAFTYIDDGIDALMLILAADPEVVNHQIFNIGNPNNECSIQSLANKIIEICNNLNAEQQIGRNISISSVLGNDYFGSNYQDVERRIPSIEAIKKRLNWNPKYDLDSALERTISWYLSSTAPLAHQPRVPIILGSVKG